MKKYNNIDDLFKDHISDFRVNPSDKVWQNIENEFLNTNKLKIRNRLIWALASLLLVISGIFTLVYINNNNNQNSVILTNNNKTNNSLTVDNSKTINNISINTEITSPDTKSDISVNKQIVSNEINSETDNTENKNNINVTKKINSNSSNNSLTDDSSIIKTDYNYENLSDNNIYLINYLSLKTNYFIENHSTPFSIDENKKITIDEYLEKRKNQHFYTGASASIAMTYYAATTDQTTWSTDLSYGLKLKQFYIESGIGFQKMKEEGIFQIDYKTNDSVGYYNKVVSFEVDPNNPNTITYKTQTTTVYDSIQHQIIQSPLYTYNYIVVPIKIGYKFFQKNKLSIAAETGLLYSYLTRTYYPTVTYNNNDSQLIGISNNTPQRTEHNFRVHIALRLNYNITKSISICAQPEFTKYINSIYDQSKSIQARPYTMGIRFGILFDF